MESESSEIKQPIAYVSDTLVPAPSDPEQEYGAIHEGQNVGEAVASLDKEILSLSDKADKDLKTHNTSEDAHADIRAAVATAQSTAESAGDDANRIVGTISTHIINTDNPHSVTASQVGADPAGTAQLLVDTHNDDLTAHPDIRQSIENMDSVCRDYITAHNESSESHEDIRTSIANVEENLNLHKNGKENPHGVTELQVLTATTETVDRSFIRADYSYEGKPTHIDCKVTDKILFEGRGGTATRFASLFVHGKLQALNITGQGNAGGHLILEGSGADSDTLTLRTVGSDSTKMGNIAINPASSTKIHGDLSINARSAVTTGDYQKTASAGDLTADGTITAKTGIKVTQKYDETTTIDVMSVDSTGLTVQAPIMLKNELGTPRIWTDSDAINIETEPPVTIKSDMDDVNITSNSGSVYIDAGGTIIDAGYKAIRLSADNSIGIYAGTVDSVGNSLALDFAETTITGNIDLPNYDNKVTIASQIDYGGEVETLGDAELLPIKKFGRTRYLATVDVLYSQGSSGIVFLPGYLYSNDLLTLPNGTVFSDYYLLNPGDTSVNPFSFSIDTSDTLSDVVFLKDPSSSVINLNIPSWGIAMVRVYISNAGTGILVGEAMKTAYIVRIEHLGTFSV